MLEQAEESLAPGTVLAGRYRVERLLGEGGMGSVLLVQHVHTDQELALKILRTAIVKDAVALERFRREARAPARIQSDHVVTVIDADVAPELGGIPFLVMELLRGKDLSAVIEERGTLPAAEVVLYLRQAARALDKAHGIGIIHRDLKPENLFLTTREDGTPWIKLLDFGIAKLTGAASNVANVGSATGTGQIFGTPLFMSPEQAKAETEKISPQTDVWALGLIAHKLLTGNDAWTAQTLTHLIAQIAYEPIKAPSETGTDLGPAYDAWFLRCLDRDPAKRFPSAGGAVTALAAALGVADAGAGAAEPTSVPLPSRRASEASLGFAATAVSKSGPRGSGETLSQFEASTGRAEAKKRWWPLALGGAIAGAIAVAVWMALGTGGGAASSPPPEPRPEDPRPAPTVAATATAPEPAVEPAPLVPASAAASASDPVPAATAAVHTGKPRPNVPVAPTTRSGKPSADDDPLSGRH